MSQTDRQALAKLIWQLPPRALYDIAFEAVLHTSPEYV